jgi:arsenate reductase
LNAHWGVEDPALVQGDEQAVRKAFFRAFGQLHHRLSIFVNLRMENLDRLALQKRLDDIGTLGDAER